MANRFPAQLFPHFYQDGPPEHRAKHVYDGWGSYGQILRGDDEPAQGEMEGEMLWGFKAQHKKKGEMWIPVEPVVTPLLPPNKAGKIPSGPPSSPDNFTEHIQHFHVHHCMDSFSTMGHLLGEHFNFHKNKPRKGCINMGRMKNVVRRLKYKKCEVRHASSYVHRYHHLLEDVICDIPSALLAELLHEELTFQRQQEQFRSDITGGVLGCVPLPNIENQNEICLIYPRGAALDSLNFHRVVLEFNEGKPNVDMSNTSLVYNLKGTVRQISTVRVDDKGLVGVRSDYSCGTWVIKDGERPRPLEVIQLKEPCTSLNVSPHICGEFVVASESGAAYLWTVGKRPQKFRDEKTNLYFNDKSDWRWCEFSAHPRVMVFADRTGAELTDSRSSDCSHTLFRIGKTAGCKSGERLIVSKYMGEVHPYHHLFTTQFSAYILDERMPSIPALKWEHMMESPPCFARVLPALDSSTSTKILLGAQRAQETVLLNYTGGCEQPCQSDGPLQKLYSPCEGLKHQLLPHKQQEVEKRLGVLAAGLTATQSNGFLTVFQFTEAGDLFSQTLKLHLDTTSSQKDLSAANCDIDLVDLPSKDKPAEEPRKDSIPQETSTVSDEEQLSDSDFEQELRQRMLSQLEVVTNDDQDGSLTSDTEVRISCEPAPVPESSVDIAQNIQARSVRPANPENASEELKLIWKKWLNSLLDLNTRKKRSLKHRRLKTNDIQVKVHRRDQLKEKERFQKLRNGLNDALKNKKLFVHGGSCLPPLDITPVPDTVDPSDWLDDLSQRLSASWAGGWKNWWEDKLGLNRDSKIQALRRKRRQEKRARARYRVALSGSFTSSTSYQDTLSGWSSSTSQYLGSDSESFATSQSAAEDIPLSEPETLPKSPVVEEFPRSEGTACSSQAIESIKPFSHTSERLELDHALPISQNQNQKHLPKKVSTVETQSVLSPLQMLKESLYSQQRQSRQQLQKDYLSSLFGSQEPSQHPVEVHDNSQLSSSGTLRMQSSGYSLAMQRLSQNRSSSQASQPQKKKSRMGF
uniref:TATA-box binding protein associated factor, RNA polymerase I subunit C n=2 Tax=Astyanax mexicanus TaxID=7994 RepID=W5L1B2_ASTMX